MASLYASAFGHLDTGGSSGYGHGGVRLATCAAWTASTRTTFDRAGGPVTAQTRHPGRAPRVVGMMFERDARKSSSALTTRELTAPEVVLAVTAPLHHIAQAARELESPALLIVGETAALGARLAAAQTSRFVLYSRPPIERARPAQHRERLREPAL